MLTLNFLNANNEEIVSLTQWDLGIKLYITNTWSYTDPPIFHFFNSKSDEAIVQGSLISSGKIVVQVPNELLKYPYSIYVNLDVEDIDGGRVTVAKGVLPVTPKAKPSYYEYVDNIRDVFTDIIAEVLEGGSPKGVFSATSELSDKDSGLYVYTGSNNTSVSPQLKNGYLYYWDKPTSTLEYLGIVYQATQLDDNSVDTDNIVDGAVNHDKLSTNAVETGNIKDGAVTFPKLNSSTVSKSTDSQTWNNVNDTTLPTTQLTKEWINTEIANAAPVVFSYTLLAESWSSGQQSVTVPNDYTHSGEVSADVDFDTTTNSQLLADDCAAVYIVSNYSNNTLTLTAKYIGNVPTEDIDIQITLTPIQSIGE